MKKAFFVTIPHSGEEIPEEVTWLRNLPETVVMCDVDRFVDQLYGPGIEKLSLPSIVAHWHRYVADLNRIPEDVDKDSVVGADKPSGSHTTGLHWVKTTKGEILMPAPITKELHELLVAKYFNPFHEAVKKQYAAFKAMGFEDVFQLDAHSMPSLGTSAHRDPGETRPEVVVSDVDGVSCKESYKELVMAAYQQQGFEVAYNWPYKGGRVTQTYGKPDQGQHAIQVELSRALYMNEETKQLIDEKAKEVSMRISAALTVILDGLE